MLNNDENMMLSSQLDSSVSVRLGISYFINGTPGNVFF